MSTATQNCEFCGSPAHIWFNCPKRPAGWKPSRLKKSTAARKDVRVSQNGGASPSGRLAEGEGLDATQTVPLQTVGTQAPPVDTASVKRGRPKGTTDRKVYQRELMRERRAKAKEQK